MAQARTLEPGASVETEVAFVLYQGVDAVTAVERQGDGFRIR